MLSALGAALAADDLQVKAANLWSGFRISTEAGRFENVQNLEEAWAAAERDAGLSGRSLESAFRCASARRRRFMNVSNPRFFLTVLGGFLGAGKTTWLRHHLRSASFAMRLWS